MPLFLRFVLLLSLSCAFAGEVSAQINPPRRPPPRVVRKPTGPPRGWFLSGAASYPTSLPRFENTISLTEFVESGSRNVRYRTPGVPGLDVGAGIQVMRRLFVGGAVSAFSASTAGAVTAEIPHPFFFNQKRTLTAPVGGLDRIELGAHIQAATILPIHRRIRVMLAAGPSVFRVRQELISNVSYNHEYPFDEVTFGAATTESQARTAFGYHAQAGVVTMFSRRLGADLLVRYSEATAVFDGSDGETFSASVGGLQFGLGLRALF